MKVKALTKLQLEPEDNGKWFVLLSDYTVEVDGKVITVPKGYHTNLTSSGRAFLPFVPRWGKYGFGAVVHDYLYDGRGYTRFECDQIFYAIMKHYKTKPLQRWIIRGGVFLLGWIWFLGD